MSRVGIGVGRRMSVIGHLATTVVLWLLILVTLGAGLASARPFRFTGAGTNHVNLTTGEVYDEVWTGRERRAGRITTRVAGWIEMTSATTFAFRASFVALDRRGDALVGTCSGDATVAGDDVHGQWTCRPTGGTGRYERVRGKWTVTVRARRIWTRGDRIKNRITVKGAGRIRGEARR